MINDEYGLLGLSVFYSTSCIINSLIWTCWIWFLWLPTSFINYDNRILRKKLNSGALHWWFKFDCRVTVNTFIARICIIFPLSYYIDHSQDLQIVKSEKGCRCWRRTGPLDQTSISWLWVKGHEHRSSWLPCQRSCESRQVQYILLSQRI